MKAKRPDRSQRLVHIRAGDFRLKVTVNKNLTEEQARSATLAHIAQEFPQVDLEAVELFYSPQFPKPHEIRN